MKVMLEPAVKYKRKSEESEERQIPSLPSQNTAIESTPDYRNRFNIIGDYEESKPTKVPDRPKFNETCDVLEKGEAKIILCWQLHLTEDVRNCNRPVGFKAKKRQALIKIQDLRSVR